MPGLNKVVFDCSLKMIKRPMYSPTSPAELATYFTEGSGMKLSKLAVPKFDGGIVNWGTFWKQLCASTHDQSHLTDTDKLAYHRESLKDVPMKNVIKGFLPILWVLQGGCWQPEDEIWLSQAHLSDPWCKLLNHDMVQQHIWALKAMEHEPFLTSPIEFKLDSTMMFEWQRLTQDSIDIPHFQNLLHFINLCAQACKASTEHSI